MDPDAAQDLQAKQSGGTGQNSGGAAAGIAAHKAKMARHTQQLKTTSGRMTGGLGTSPGNPVTQNTKGAFLAKGKN